MSTLSARRPLLVVAVLAMVATMLFAINAGTASASTACPASIPSAGFTDTGGLSQETQDAIDCIAFYDIAQGTTATTYSPSDNVTRSQMALFLTRKLAVAGVALPSGSPQGFTDIGHLPSTTQKAINQLAQLGVTLGTSSTTYDPAGYTTRSQMALFITRQLTAAGVALPSGSPQGFTDIGALPAATQTAINQLAQLDITKGTTATTYSPAAYVTRAQMALFLARDIQVMGVDAPDFTHTFTASPAGLQMLQFDPNGTDWKVASVTVSGLDPNTDYNVSLFAHADGDEGSSPGVTNNGGVFTFRDAQDSDPTGPFDGKADYNCSTYNGAEIISINGATSTNNECDWGTANTSDENGEMYIRFRNSPGYSDSAWLVVWDDANGNDELDLDAMNRPSEDFTAAGPIVWSGGEAPNGNTDLNGEYVLYIDHAARMFVSSDVYWYSWDSNDVFNYYQEYNITFAEFNDWINLNDYLYNDDVDGATNPYSRTASNDFQLYDEADFAPTITSVSVGDFDSGADTAANDVRLSWNVPGQGNFQDDVNEYAGFCIVRRNPTTYASVTTDCWDSGDHSAKVDAQVSNMHAGNTATWTVEDVPAGNWAFTVYSVSSSNYDSDDSQPTATVTTQVASGSPKSIATTTNDVGGSGTLNSGDILTVKFDQEMNPTGPGESITVKDADGTTCTLTDPTNATFVYSTDVVTNNTITITVTGAPDCSKAGTVGGLQYPVTVMSSSNIIDSDQGLPWDITGSPDKMFN
ncbi:MAG: S-layer homology domain-containing protein [Acidimicrobiia bacterium]|nr:S-layer homology domain-containing protein [Acidimicrobiia bacterium]